MALTNLQEEIKAAGADLGQIDKILEKIEDRLHDIEDSTEGLAKATSEEVGEYQNLDQTFRNIMQKREQIVKSINEEETATQKLAEAQETVNEAQEDGVKKVKEYETSYGRLGSEANTALGIIAAGLAKTNPGLSAAIGAVQKLIPNVAECAKMFDKVGLQAVKAGKSVTTFGRLLKVAMSPTGIMLVVTAVTSLISVLSNLNKKHKEAEQAAKDHAEAEKQAAIDARKEWASFEEQINAIIYGQEYAARKLAHDTIESVGGTDYYNKFVKTIVDQYKAGTIDLDEANRQFHNQTRGLAEETVKAYQSLYKLDLQDYKSYLDKKKKEAEDNAKATANNVIDYDALKMKMDATTEAVLDSLDGMVDRWSEEQKKKAKQAIEEFRQLWASTAEGKDLAYRTNRDKIIGGLDLSADETENEEENAEYDRMKKIEDAEKAIFNSRLENYSNFISSYASLTESISGMIADNLDAELEAGKITESEYKRRKKALQAFQISSIVASTASGIVDVWRAFATEKIGNAEAAAATGPAAPATLAALNAKSLTSAILQTGTLAAAGAAGIASIKNDSISSASATPSASISTPVATQTYVANEGYKEYIDSSTQAAKTTVNKPDTQVVLVVDDYEKVASQANRVSVQSTF